MVHYRKLIKTKRKFVILTARPRNFSAGAQFSVLRT